MAARRIDERLSEAEQRERSQQFRRFRAISQRLEAERDELTARYPEMWIAIGEDGVEVAADSHEAVIAQIDQARIAHGDVIIEFLTNQPQNFIL
jgi:hypothetical protein